MKRDFVIGGHIGLRELLVEKGDLKTYIVGGGSPVNEEGFH